MATTPRKDLPGTNAPNWSQRVTEELRVLMGRGGNGRALTAKDLIDSGIAKPGPGGGLVPGVPGGGDTEPDLTPPPMPTGFAVSAGLSTVFVEHDAPAYTQGHGHDRTVVYGVLQTGSTAPTFDQAVVLFQFQGTIGAYPAALGTRYRLWIKWQSQDGVQSVSPAGGTNGLDVQTGKIGNNDLGPLIVEAGNLANGSVSASKLAAQAVDATKFAAGIEPVSVSTAGTLPTVKSTSTIVWQGKLYRWDGSKYTAAVPTVDLTGTIIASQIAAGAIDATKFASGIEPVTNSAAASLPTVKSTTVITWQGKLYRWDGSKYTAEVSSAELADNAVTVNKIAAGAVEAGKLATGAVTADKIAAAAVDATKFASGIEPVTNSAAASLPTVKSTNVITWQGKLYRWDGAKYTPEVAAVDLTGQLQSSQLADNAVTTAKIASGAVDTAKFAAGIQPVTVSTAGALPTAKTTETLVWQGKLYRWSGTAYTAAVATTDLTGQIIAGQIAAGAVDAAKFASGIEPVTNATGGSLPTTKSTTVITWNGKLYRWDGTKYSAEVAVGDMVGQIAATQIADNAITTPKLAANSVAAGKIAANAVTANEISANAVTAAKIAAGAVGADQIAANAITAKHLTLGDFTNLWSNPLFDNAEAGWVGLAANIAQYSGTEGKGVLITATTTTAAAVVASDASVITSGMMACRGGEKLYLSATVTRKVGTAAKVATLQVQYLNVNGTSATVSALSGTSSGTAVDFGGEYTLPATAVAFRLRAQMNATNVAGDAIALTNIVARRMSAGELIVDGAITADKIAALAVNAGKIAASAVTADNIQANAITTAKIAAGAVSADQIAAKAVTTDKLVIGNTTNLLSEPTFDNGGIGWNGLTTPQAWREIATVTGPEGAPINALRFTPTTADQSVNNIDWPCSGNPKTMRRVQPGTQFKYTVVWRVVSGTAGSIRMRHLEMYEGSTNSWQVPVSLPGTSANGTWVTSTGMRAIPLDRTHVGVQINCSGGVGTVFEVASIVMEQMATGELIVDGAITANKVAALAITAGKIAANAVTATELAANSVIAGKIAVNAITADNLQANSVTTAKIATGAVSANEIAAGAITAQKMAITSQDTVNVDPFFEDASLWNQSPWVRKQIAGSPGPNVLSTTVSSSITSIGTRAPIDTSKTYLFEVWFMASAASPNRGFAQIRFFDVNGAQLVGADAIATGWPGTNNSGSTGNFYFPAVGSVTPTTWTRYTLTVGPDGTAKFPEKAAYFTTGAFVNYAGAAPVVESYWGGLRVVEMSRGELIVDGAITAAKIAAKTITAAEIAAGTITATELGANSVTANSLAANSVIAGKIAANAVTADSIAANSVTTAKIAAGAVSATELAAGSVLASKLVVSDTSTLVPDSEYQDLDMWFGDSGGTVQFKLNESNALAGTVSKSVLQINRVTTGTAYDGGRSSRFAVSPNTDYVLRVNVWTSAAAMVKVRVVTLTTGDVSRSTDVDYTYSTANWASHEVKVRTSATESRAQIYVYIREDSTATYLYVGKMRFQEAAAGALIVDGAIIAAKLATNSVTANAIAANSVTTNAIAANAVTANEIAANSITAAKIATGAVNADQIAANAILASKLVISDQSNMLADTEFKDLTYWLTANCASSTDATAVAALNCTPVMANTAGATANMEFYNRNSGYYMSVEPGKVYRLSIQVYIAAGWNGRGQLNAQGFSANGTTGTTSTNAYTADYRTNAASGATTVTLTLDYTATAATSFVRFRFLATYTNAAVAGMFFGRPRMWLKQDADLIVDGAIVATKIAAGAIAVGTAAIQDGAIVNAMIGNLAADKITAGTLNAARIAAGTITSSHLAANSVIAGKIAANAVTAGTIAANAVTATQIAAGAITVDKLAAGSVTAEKLTVGTGGNLCPDSAFTPGLAFWGFWSPHSQYQSCLRSVNLNADYSVPGSPTYFMQDVTQYGAGGSIDTYFKSVYSSPVSVVPGERYELSIYGAWHRCNGRVHAEFRNASGGAFGLTKLGNDIINSPGGGQVLSNYVRAGGFVTVPAGAVSMVILMQQGPLLANQTDKTCYMFLTRPFIGLANPNQTELSPWTPSSNTNILPDGITTPSISALAGKFGDIEIRPTAGASGCIRVYDANGTLRVRLGVW